MISELTTHCRYQISFLGRSVSLYKWSISCDLVKQFQIQSIEPVKTGSRQIVKAASEKPRSLRKSQKEPGCCKESHDKNRSFLETG